MIKEYTTDLKNAVRRYPNQGKLRVFVPEKTNLAVNEMLNNISDGGIYLWATSAGGVCAFRYAAENPGCVSGIIGTFPVFDTASVFPV